MVIMSLRRKGFLGVKEYEKTLLKKKDDKRIVWGRQEMVIISLIRKRFLGVKECEGKGLAERKRTIKEQV